MFDISKPYCYPFALKSKIMTKRSIEHSLLIPAEDYENALSEYKSRRLLDIGQAATGLSLTASEGIAFLKQFNFASGSSEASPFWPLLLLALTIVPIIDYMRARKSLIAQFAHADDIKSAPYSTKEFLKRFTINAALSYMLAVGAVNTIFETPISQRREYHAPEKTLDI